MKSFAFAKRPTVCRCFVAAALLVFSGACRRAPPLETIAKDRGETRLHDASITELFVEIPQLVVGQASKLAVHVTRRSDWKPLAAGKVSLEIGDQRSSVDGARSPGIWAPVLTPKVAGDRPLVITVELDGAAERHELGIIRVHPDVASAAAFPAVENPAGAAGAIRFVMEQQWRTDFGVEAAGERPMRASVAVFGSIRGRPEADALVRAPLAGQIGRAGTTFPRIGDAVTLGQPLSLLTPRFDATIDVGALARERARGEAALTFAQRERERAERLSREGLSSERDVETARRDEAIARAEVAASKRSMSAGMSNPGSAGGLPILAPFAGQLVSVDTAPAAFVDRGAVLFRVADVDRVWVELRVPETELARIGAPSGAAIEVAARRHELAGDSLVAVGKAIDPISRTAPLIFDFDNREARTALGTSIRGRVYLGGSSPVVAVPIAAVVDDEGQAVVYVRTDGEAFARRAVVLGPKDGGFVAITQGLAAGERVVVRGSYTLKLAASSGSVPDHGHAH